MMYAVNMGSNSKILYRHKQILKSSCKVNKKRKIGIEALNNNLFSYLVIFELKEERETDSRSGNGVRRFGHHR